jgi:hypothetical protein
MKATECDPQFMQQSGELYGREWRGDDSGVNMRFCLTIMVLSEVEQEFKSGTAQESERLPERLVFSEKGFWLA